MSQAHARSASSTGYERTTWKPLLTGVAAQESLEAIEAIGEALQALSASWPVRYSLPGGYSGMALFYAYRRFAEGATVDEDRAIEFLARSVDGLSGENMAPGLHSGFSGVAWAIEHLRGSILDPDDEVGISAIDSAVVEALRSFETTHPSLKGNFDFISGLSGLGVYGLERLPDPRGLEIVDLVIQRLDEMAERRSDGIAWFTPRELVPPNQLEDAPNGYYNFGLAHGVPGILGFLGHACAAGAGSEKARELLEGGVHWLLQNENPEGVASRFPTWRGPEISGWDHSRLAWCYGDPGVAAALMWAGLGAANPSWCKKAVEVAISAASIRPEPESSNMDGGLCHGSAGLSLIFNCLYQISGDTTIREGALHWLEHTLAMRKPDRGIAGFQAWGPGESEKLEWLDDPGLLTGAAGIGLVLIAATSAVEPAWKRSLLLPDLPRSETNSSK